MRGMSTRERKNIPRIGPSLGSRSSASPPASRAALTKAVVSGCQVIVKVPLVNLRESFTAALNASAQSFTASGVDLRDVAVQSFLSKEKVQ